jgi:hypothetical protein
MWLKWFNRGILGLSVLILLWQFVSRYKGDTIRECYFSLTLIAIASGLELVRAELEDLKGR